ncbi:MAG: response regulator [Nitrososphaeria archaeon]|nr:response regulator [Nitrososphaeria archaeon]
MKVLIIDDNKPLTETMASFLELKKVQCKVAINGKGGLDCILKERFDFVLLDLSMPGVSGYSIYTHLKKTNMLRLNRVIIITGNRLFDSDIREMMHSGVQRIIKKPFSLMDLYNEMIKISSLPTKQTIHV